MKVSRAMTAAITSLAITMPVGATAVAQTETQDSEEAGSCPAMHVILAPGTSETMQWGDPNSDSHGYLTSLVTPVLSQVNDPGVMDKGAGFSQSISGNSHSMSAQVASQGATPTISRTYVTYPATAGGAWAGMGIKPGTPRNFGDATSYDNSVKQGVEKTLKVAEAVADKCPDTSISLIGYSQGAEVMSAVSRKIGAGETNVGADHIGGVALFADPTREAGTPTLASGGDAIGQIPKSKSNAVSGTLSGLSQIKTPKASGLSRDETGQRSFGALNERVISWCLPGDYVCGLPAESKMAKNLVQVLEKIELDDPVKALQLLAESVDGAVKASNYSTSNVADLDYGPDGFKAAGLQDQTNPDTSVLAERTRAYTSASSDATDTASPASESVTESATGSETEAVQNGTSQDSILPTEVTRTNGGITTTESHGATPTTSGKPDPLASPENFFNAVVPLTARLGGMALGTGITVARKTLTPENIAQIALAGVSGGPQAAAAVAGEKFAKTGMTLLNPSYVSGRSREVLQAVKDSGFTVPETMELAVDLSSWLSVDEHVQYGKRPIMPDGRTAEQATQQWLVAGAGDMTGNRDLLGSSPHGFGSGSSVGSVSDVIDAARQGAGDATFNSASASDALKALMGAK